MAARRPYFLSSFFVSPLIILVVVASARAQPANDDCANATVVVDGVYPGTSLGALTDGFTTCGSGGGSNVWYRFIAPYNGLLTAHVCVAANFDTVLSIHNGCPLDGGAQLVCNDDSCGMLRSIATVDITASAQYLISVGGFEGESGNFTLTILSTEAGNPTGPDVVLSDLTEVVGFTPETGIRAYMTDTHTCNIGDQNLAWGANTPIMTWNAYRLFGGRIEQIGLSWAKDGAFAAAGPGCGQLCSGAGGPVLGPGCKDVYGASFNSDQGILGPRSQVNAFNGAYPGPSGLCDVNQSICKRLQIVESDLDAALFPDALYFFEVVFVAPDDAASGNAFNNASHKRVAVGEGFNIGPAGPIIVGHPAIEAWRDHGLGLNMPDPDVILGTIDVQDEGRFHFAYRVRELGGGQWHYDYAIFNLNSHRSGGSFHVPVPPGVAITNVAIHDTFYHSGEPFDNTDWTTLVDSTGVTWSSPQTFAQNPNSNALRYGTLYNFSFDASAPPSDGTVTLGLFRPGTPDSVTTTMKVPFPTSTCGLLGDVSGDTLIDGLDIPHFVSCALTGGSPGGNCACADMNSSGGFDDTDVTLFVAVLTGP